MPFNLNGLQVFLTDQKNIFSLFFLTASNFFRISPQKFEWDLGSQPLSVEENLIVHVKDWERIGRNR